MSYKNQALIVTGRPLNFDELPFEDIEVLGALDQGALQHQTYEIWINLIECG